MKDLPPTYARSRFVALRRVSRVVNIGPVRVGGNNPIAVQSMTNTPTQAVEATVAQAVALAAAGCRIVRVTAPNMAAAQALADIRRDFTAAGFGDVPLVADIHFLPAAAMEAALHVEKVRINPGNYADRKISTPRAYTQEEYDSELQRLYEAVTPLILRCRELGRAIRIGVNHGSLSDRILNRFGDTPAGMCEGAMEFLRICESHGFRDVVVSMKASNPRIMLEATRLMAARMDAEGLPYPLHLGVTEAGGGEDARVKGALGIGTMLRDGLGDTIRVSLTEDPVAEVPVALALAVEAEKLWARTAEAASGPDLEHDGINPFVFARRECVEVAMGAQLKAGGLNMPRVAVHASGPIAKTAKALSKIAAWHAMNPRMRMEGIILTVTTPREATALPVAVKAVGAEVPFAFVEIAPKKVALTELLASLPDALKGMPLSIVCTPESREELSAALECHNRLACALALDLAPKELERLLPALKVVDPKGLLFTSSRPQPPLHPVGQYRLIAEMLRWAGIKSAIWIRHTKALMDEVRGTSKADETARLMDAGILIGGLLCDGIGDIVSTECEPGKERAIEVAYGILQGARSRTTRTEFVACPSCGRTLFDIETTLQSVREATGHLQGITIAVMGCIVNGPGEMADADFGYVGGAPGKVNLYVGKTPVQFNIPSAEAVGKLVELIKQNRKWHEPA
jgi:(E)-4-hydroxy-3-methylbut-2-enyl-diphosphate synthase